MVSPITQWEHRQFDAPDPWQAGNETVRWRLLVCLLLGGRFADRPPERRTVPAESNDVPKKFAIVIATDRDQRYRVLPLALQDLWRAGKVQDRDLPRLLHDMEGKLKWLDYPALGVLPTLFGAFAIAMGGVGALSLGLFVFHILSAGWGGFSQLENSPWMLTLVLGIPSSILALFFWLLRLPFTVRRRKMAERFLAALTGNPDAARYATA
jgi:hypothetical protein